MAAQPFGIPIAHIHGGETTEGAIDEAFRHCITKMSHIHFATTESHKQRIIQLGEQEQNVFNCGAPALDFAATFLTPNLDEMQNLLGIKLHRKPFIVTYHPETVDFSTNEKNLFELLETLETITNPIIFTASNADTTGRALNKTIQERCRKNDNFHFFQNLGLENYYGLLGNAEMMIGNSSSGIIEAATFQLPVINLGNRQKSRFAGDNVIHCKCKSSEIKTAISTVRSKNFRIKLSNLNNPYYKGGVRRLSVTP